MPETDEPAVSVTLAEIARIAGVGRAAVSNWRRRHDTFPAPIGGTDTSPQFSLPEVETWLRANNRFKAPAGLLERLWPRFDALGDRDAMGRVIAALGLGAGDGNIVAPELQLGPVEQALLEDSRAVAREEGTAEVFWFLLDRWLTAHVRQIATTAEPLASVMAEIAAATTRQVRTVLDPACGTGTLLIAAARQWQSARLVGQDADAVMAAVAAARLSIENGNRRIEVKATDSLRGGTHANADVDVVLCSPPTNERDWGQEELTTDPRWAFGLPPRSESELAWVQEVIASLSPDGTGVLLLPPTVATRRAGRRIRSNLLRTGALRAVVALPVGAAAPYGVGLHLWVVRRPPGVGADDGVLLVDTGDCRTTSSGGRAVIDWGAVRDRAVAALQGGQVDAARVLPPIELLGGEVDLSPARHVAGTGPAASGAELREAWAEFRARLEQVADLSRMLSALGPSSGARLPSVSVAELERGGAVTIRPGHPVPDELLGRGDRPEDAFRFLSMHDLMSGDRARNWVGARTFQDAELTVAEPGDIVVVGAQRAFDAWVQEPEQVVLGAQLMAVRPDREQLDPWYLAGCLRTPANARRAGGHASTSSRIDIRRLEVPRLPLDEQRHYGELFRELATFTGSLRRLAETGTALGDTLGGLLAAGHLHPGES
ncbi:N-6 DNA methylase [Actinomadura bangladeshensis]|uniref:Methyltransferase domain-containing protein n=1 Tax=Actinomadura bangladeshensis TaxID=453573 RepID=A0A4R4NWA5_9ACTN|nr:N-6 DNA methylase [Actinomadura bangladeshensis]TDC13815.1 methyltransferase domain-containing protein [Actinomadura bangladeshensis]